MDMPGKLIGHAMRFLDLLNLLGMVWIQIANVFVQLSRFLSFVHFDEKRALSTNISRIQEWMIETLWSKVKICSGSDFRTCFEQVNQNGVEQA